MSGTIPLEVDASFFKGNREKLTAKLNGGLVILTAFTRMQRTNDAAHRFQQEANFWYMCGIDEPDWTLIIDGTQHKTWIVMPDVSDVHRTFDGALDLQTAKEISGADKVITADEGASLLRTLAKRHTLVYTLGLSPHADSFNFTQNPAPLKHYQMLERIFERVQDCRSDLAKLRAIKQPSEIMAIDKAVRTTTESFERVHKHMADYKHEYEIEADFGHDFRKTGAAGHAYDPIIASGVNACTLHYGRNQSKLRSRSLVLMDVGASYGGYAADITRTYAKGTPTKRQLEVHSVVASAHQQIINLLEPQLSVESYQKTVDDIMTDAIRQLGLYENQKSLRRYFPHAISHGLGIDVHDSLGGPKFFEENMVLTVEPGIYIPDEAIGVRIEDDILITKRGHRNLSGHLSTGL